MRFKLRLLLLVLVGFLFLFIYIINLQFEMKTTTIITTNSKDIEKDNTIFRLKTEIDKLKMQIKKLSSINNSVSSTPSIETYVKRVHSRWKNGTISSGGLQFHNEFEMYPFVRFTYHKIFLVDPGLGKRVVEKPIGFKRRDIIEIVDAACKVLNKNRKQLLYNNSSFKEGITKTEPTLGSIYELFFKDLDDSKKLVRVTLSRPFTPLFALNISTMHVNDIDILIIIPLSFGRVDKLKLFIDNFITNDLHLILMVVYFDVAGVENVETEMKRLKRWKLVKLNEPFSRGRGLQVGVDSWTDSFDVLLFFCDVDIVFNAEFLERCRSNAEKGHRVYYPMVFSLYNPKVIYTMHGLPIPSQNKQMIISRDIGFWRDFGYGMTCQFKSDFETIKGFDKKVSGWGKEDVLLYQKYVKSSYVIIRSPDNGIFHLWHEKDCHHSLPIDQYRACLSSRALTEASHRQLGILAFQEEMKMYGKSNN